MVKNLLLLSLLVVASAASAQTSDILNQLHPRPKAGFVRTTGAFPLVSTPPIVVPDIMTATGHNAIAYLNRALRQALGDTLPVVRMSQAGAIKNAIFCDEGTSTAMRTKWHALLAPSQESGPKYDSAAEGYTLDVTSDQVLLMGNDSAGLFNAVTTLVQFLNGPSLHPILPGVHIRDYPDYPVRWAFTPFNMQVNANVGVMQKIEDTMAAHKMNGILDADFKNNVLDIVPSWFFSNMDSLHRISREHNIEMTESMADIGYSEGILFHDPNLAEGMQAVQRYYVEGDTGRITGDPNVSLPNGGFENVDNNGLFTGFSWYDSPNKCIYVDHTTVHSGNTSAKITNISGNCRFERTMPCQPHSNYLLSVWVKTEGYSGYFQLLGLGQDNKGNTVDLTATQYSPASTGDWTKYVVELNTENCTSLLLYVGSWGGSGTMWLDDFNVQPSGMTNVLRRKGTPLSVKNFNTGRFYTEGVDFMPIHDLVMEASFGQYPWHPGPTIHCLPTGAIKNGDSLVISFFHAVPTLAGQNGDGQDMVCLSEDTLMSILKDQMTRVNNLDNPRKAFFGHDEIRLMNWDSACLNRHMTPAQLLARNIVQCDSLVKSIHPGIETFLWSDMVDSLHNAHNNYYLVNGDLSGDWNMIPKTITIANWNGGYGDTSLMFFARHGFSQITAPYYDDHSTNSIRKWRLQMDTVPNIRGMMYTTWQTDYSYLTPFADYAWSAGSAMYHTPLDSSAVAKLMMGDSALVAADIYPDPYDKNDAIRGAAVKVSSMQGAILGHEIVRLTRTSATHYQGYIHLLPNRGYYLVDTNLQGLIRTSPVYLFETSHSSVGKPSGLDDGLTMTLSPNPATTTFQFAVQGVHIGGTVSLLDERGAVLKSVSVSSEGVGMLDVRDLAEGTYFCVATFDDKRTMRKVVVKR